MENSLAKEFRVIQQKIVYFNYIAVINPCPYMRNYYGSLINNELKKLNKFIYLIDDKSYKRQAKNEFTLDELAKYDGANGAPAYAAVNGVVYDVSLSPAWGGGTHFGLYAGKDFTSQFRACHKDQVTILDNLPVVGKIKS